MKLLVASRNKKKLAELDRILHVAGVDTVELVSLADVAQYPERAEDGLTFEDNAFIKSSDGATNTGFACVSDDSGLSVDELRGMPGVLSARWSGEHGDDQANNHLVLAQMLDVPDERRGATFHSVCALTVPGAGNRAEELRTKFGVGDANSIDVQGLRESGASILRVECDADNNLRISTRGSWRGRLLREPVGENGFGYDPLFVPGEEDSRVRTEGSRARSSAELSADEKDALSHRGRALRALVEVLSQLAD